jgi:hypothetical protein
MSNQQTEAGGSLSGSAGAASGTGAGDNVEPSFGTMTWMRSVGATSLSVSGGRREGQGRMLHITWSLVFECAVTNTDSVTSHQ